LAGQPSPAWSLLVAVARQVAAGESVALGCWCGHASSCHASVVRSAVLWLVASGELPGVGPAAPAPFCGAGLVVWVRGRSASRLGLVLARRRRGARFVVRVAGVGVLSVPAARLRVARPALAAAALPSLRAPLSPAR